jgi:carboxyl-terminal processing protease
MILDLRQNGGGILGETLTSLSPFFIKDTAAGIALNRNGQRPITIIGQKKNTFAGDVAVLTDEFVGSSAELFCWIFRYYKRGLIIGKKTAGKLVGMTGFDLSNDVTVTVPIEDYRMPNEERIEGVGVMPDIAITESSGNPIRFGHDRWLEKAIEILNKPPQ